MSRRPEMLSTHCPAIERTCLFCRRVLEETARPDAKFCGQKCRQAAFRLRQRRTIDVVHGQPMRFCYADPPYPGKAKKYYGKETTYGGEVDHAKLIASLVAGGYDGWALSTSAKGLRDVLPLCPPEARICAWVKPHGAAPLTFGLHNCWEPLIVVGGRQQRPGVRDWLCAQPARFGGTLAGRKPVAFCAWLFDCLGMQPGDELVDMFPGTGAVGGSWNTLSRAAPDDASRECSSDLSPAAALEIHRAGPPRRLLKAVSR